MHRHDPRAYSLISGISKIDPRTVRRYPSLSYADLREEGRIRAVASPYMRAYVCTRIHGLISYTRKDRYTPRIPRKRQ